jgi:SDR family mycofactocin-dependent oxidoreductase
MDSRGGHSRGRLEGMVAFITGGARGQGRAIAAKFASEGADIIICDVGEQIEMLAYPLATADDMAATVDLVHSHRREIVAQVADVRSQDELDRVVDAGLSAFGKIDIVVANAGILDCKPFWEIPESEWQEVVDINLSGVWRTAKAVAPHMIARRSGCMIFTSSVNGVEGGADYLHYVSSKHGVIGLMRGAALELAPHNIRVHAVLPGPIDTVLNDNPPTRDRIAGRPGATREEYLAAVRNWHALRGRSALPPETIADAMVWLASDEAKHATGMEMVIDAGHMLLPGMNPNPIEDDDVMLPTGGTAVPGVA